MAGNNWLAERRSAAATDRILDAAKELFSTRGPDAVGMHEIATAAGCSRATLYRYFENREALHNAYMHREAQVLYATLTKRLAAISDPRVRLVEGFLTCLALVRQSPPLNAWFAGSATPIGMEIAGQSDVITAMGASFVVSLGLLDNASRDGTDIDRKARWLVRALTSFLLLPGRNGADERAMVEQFLVPTLIESR